MKPLVVECMICSKKTAGGTMPIQLCRKCAAVLHKIIIEERENDKNKA